MRINNNPTMQWLPFITLCDWSRKHAPPSEPMKCNTSTIHDYHSRFPALYTSWKPIQAYSEIYLSLVSCLDYFDFASLYNTRRPVKPITKSMTVAAFKKEMSRSEVVFCVGKLMWGEGQVTTASSDWLCSTCDWIGWANSPRGQG